MVLAAGEAFPDRALPLLEGDERRLADFWAKGPALVVVGHGDCGTTRLTLPLVERIHARRGPGTSVVLVLQEDTDSADALLAHLGVALPAFLDEAPYALEAELGLETVPSLFLVDRGGAVARVVEGFDRAAFEELARAVGVSGPLFEPDEETPLRRPG